MWDTRSGKQAAKRRHWWSNEKEDAHTNKRKSIQLTSEEVSNKLHDDVKDETHRQTQCGALRPAP